jgi:hypothetical protein
MKCLDPALQKIGIAVDSNDNVGRSNDPMQRDRILSCMLCLGK